MNRILRGVLALLVCLPACVVAQDDVPTARTKGAIFKDDIDRLVGSVRDAARRANQPSLGGDSVLATGQLLTAMGHCHRRYHVSDGPVVRPSIEFLIKRRNADGTFGDATATMWAIEALAVMDPDGFREEIAAARASLGKAGPTDTGFAAAVSQVLGKVRADVFPQHVGANTQQQVRGWLANPSTPIEPLAAADALLELTACQVANKLLDAGQEPKVAAPAVVFSPAQQKAFAWLWSQQKDGIFSVKMGDKSFADPALTGFGLLSLQTKPKAQRTADEQAVIEKGLRWLIDGQNADGTFGQQLPNYTTCAVIAALSHWGDAVTIPVLQRAQRAILGFQNIESGGYQSSDRDYGSIGYGSSQRGDLSNLHFSLEALRATGLPADHEAFTKALVFLQRTQNLKAVNDFSGKVPDLDHEGVMLDATSGDDGGAAYYPGNSAAGYLVQPDGKSVPRSYGSMTYALLKSYTLSGLAGDDPRVQAAVRWIQDNWTLAVNPGSDPALGEKVKYQGLFYYYMVLAQALDIAGLRTVEVPAKDATGAAILKDGAAVSREVDWRQELRAHLEGMQQADGSWRNAKNDRWMEGMPLLCTCYALIALERCR